MITVAKNERLTKDVFTGGFYLWCHNVTAKEAWLAAWRAARLQNRLRTTVTLRCDHAPPRMNGVWWLMHRATRDRLLDALRDRKHWRDYAALRRELCP